MIDADIFCDNDNCDFKKPEGTLREYRSISDSVDLKVIKANKDSNTDQ
jgi:hypothetical protein